MPNISVSLVQSGEFLSYDVAGDLTIRDLKSFINAESGIPTDSLVLIHNGRPLANDAETLQGAGITDHDMLAAEVRAPTQQTRQQGIRTNNSSQQAAQPSQEHLNHGVEELRQRLLRRSYEREELARIAPNLINVIDDPVRFREAWVAFDQTRRQEAEQRYANLTSDDVTSENQAAIEEYIREQNVEKERELAMHENPEFFAPVTMLYIDLEVNGHPVKAFVDSGAQATIMSPSCAETCNVTRLLDRRFAGIAKGVGTSRILGKVHRATVRIGDAELPCAFTVMEGKDIDMLLGLDMLKRYQASIDLFNNRLVLRGGVSVPFLGESEIPQRFLEAIEDEPTISGPGGTAIGAKSGAIKTAPESASKAPSSSSSGPSRGNFGGTGHTLGATPSEIERPHAPTPSQAAPEFPQESIDALEQLGATRAQAIEALRASGGNLELAAGLVYDM